MLQKLYRRLRSDLWLRAAFLSGVFALVLFILLMGQPRFTNASRPAMWGDAQLSMQFAKNTEEVEWIVGDSPSADREVMRFKTYLDFPFIACYVTLLVSLGMRVARQNAPLGWAIAISALSIGLFDVLENRAILEVVNARLRVTSQEMVDAIRRAATVKWTLAGLTLTLFVTRLFRKTT